MDKPRPRRFLVIAAPLAVGLAVPAAVWWICRPAEQGLADDFRLGPGRGAAVAADPVAELEALLRHDPVAFLDRCLAHYDATVTNYSTILDRHERVGGELKEPETIRCLFREKPFSVYMHWTGGANQAKVRADKVLYVDGRHGNQLIAHPTGLLSFVKSAARDPLAPDVMSTTRYSIKEFGLRWALVRARQAFADAAARDELHFEYLGVQTVAEAGGRRCFAVRRDRYARPEADGVEWLLLHIDCERLVPVRSEMRDRDGALIGRYVFRDTRFGLDELTADYFAPERFGL
jgi:hypothetical protein